MIALPDKIRTNSRKRVGRGIGSTWGKTCGRGHNGQKSRAGYSRKRFFTGGQTKITLSIPKSGFTSYISQIRKMTHRTLTTDQVKNLDHISLENLYKSGLIGKQVTTIKIVKGHEDFVRMSYDKSNIMLTKSVAEIYHV